MITENEAVPVFREYLSRHDSTDRVTRLRLAVVKTLLAEVSLNKISELDPTQARVFCQVIQFKYGSDFSKPISLHDVPARENPEDERVRLRREQEERAELEGSLWTAQAAVFDDAVSILAVNRRDQTDESEQSFRASRSGAFYYMKPSLFIGDAKSVKAELVSLFDVTNFRISMKENT